MIFKEWYETQKILTKNDLMFDPEVNGLQWDQVTYGGLYDQQLMLINDEKLPVNGTVYEFWDENENNDIEEYRSYKNGFIDGQSIVFHKNKNIKKILICYQGAVSGPKIDFYENGCIKEEKFYSIGYNILNILYDENENIIEKKYNKDIFYEERLKKEYPDLYKMFISKIEFFV